MGVEQSTVEIAGLSVISVKHCVLENNPFIFPIFYVGEKKKVAALFTYCTLTHISGYIEEYCYFCMQKRQWT